MKNSSIFNETRGLGMSTSYSKIGGRGKNKRNIEEHRYGNVTQNKEEIELCLTCTYPKCVVNCKRLREFRKTQKKTKLV